MFERINKKLKGLFPAHEDLCADAARRYCGGHGTG